MRLSSKSLDWSLSHCTREFPTLSLFPKLFELEVIKENWSQGKGNILSAKFPKDWTVQESRELFAPKHHNLE